MKMLLTADRIRAALDDARTEKDVELSLRAHKIRYSYDTRTGILAFRIPVRSGSVLIVRTASRNRPFRLVSAVPGPAAYHVPVLHKDY